MLDEVIDNRSNHWAAMSIEERFPNLANPNRDMSNEGELPAWFRFVNHGFHTFHFNLIHFFFK